MIDDLEDWLTNGIRNDGEYWEEYGSLKQSTFSFLVFPPLIFALLFLPIFSIISVLSVFLILQIYSLDRTMILESELKWELWGDSVFFISRKYLLRKF